MDKTDDSSADCSRTQIQTSFKDSSAVEMHSHFSSPHSKETAKTLLLHTEGLTKIHNRLSFTPSALQNITCLHIIWYLQAQSAAVLTSHFKHHMEKQQYSRRRFVWNIWRNWYLYIIHLKYINCTYPTREKVKHTDVSWRLWKIPVSS